MWLFLLIVWFIQGEGEKILAGHFLSFAIYFPLFHHFSIIYVHVLFIWAFMKENSIAIKEKKIFLYIQTSTHIIRPKKISFLHLIFLSFLYNGKTTQKLIPSIEKIFILFIYFFIPLLLGTRSVHMWVGDEHYSVCIAYVSIQCRDTEISSRYKAKFQMPKIFGQSQTYQIRGVSRNFLRGWFKFFVWKENF